MNSSLLIGTKYCKKICVFTDDFFCNWGCLLSTIHLAQSEVENMSWQSWKKRYVQLPKETSTLKVSFPNHVALSLDWIFYFLNTKFWQQSLVRKIVKALEIILFQLQQMKWVSRQAAILEQMKQKSINEFIRCFQQFACITNFFREFFFEKLKINHIRYFLNSRLVKLTDEFVMCQKCALLGSQIKYLCNMSCQSVRIIPVFSWPIKNQFFDYWMCFCEQLRWDNLTFKVDVSLAGAGKPITSLLRDVTRFIWQLTSSNS